MSGWSDVPALPLGSSDDKVRVPKIEDSGEFYGTAVIGFRKWVLAPGQAVRKPDRLLRGGGASMLAQEFEEVYSGEAKLLSTVPFQVNNVGRTEWSLDGVTEAHCIYNSNHVAPVEYCSCGLYAHDSPKHAMDEQGGTIFRGADLYVPVVAGVVAQWGIHDLYGKGMRSQYSKILALVEPNEVYNHGIQKFGVGELVVRRQQDAAEATESLRNLCAVNDIPLLPFDFFLDPMNLEMYRMERGLAMVSELL